MKHQAYNPYLPLNVCIPDGEPHVFGDRLYVYGSHDKEGGSAFCVLDYEVWSSPTGDLGDWRCEGTVYRAQQDPDYGKPNTAMYAPDCVQGPDGRFYLYYAMSGGNFTGPIHVAVCDTPAGRYEYYGEVRNPDGTTFTKNITFDPGVMNDDGRIWLYYGWSLAVSSDKARAALSAGGAGLTKGTASSAAGTAADSRGQAENTLTETAAETTETGAAKAAQAGAIPQASASMSEQLVQVQIRMFGKTEEEVRSTPGTIMGANVVELASDMLTVIAGPDRIVPGQFTSFGTEFEGHAFFEASSMRKIGDTYYFIYSSEHQHELCYATSAYPDREFHYGGVIIDSGDIGLNGRTEQDRLAMTGNNHGSLVNVNGQWYMFYHRPTHKTTFSRQGCAEKVVILPDGRIPQAEITSCGLNDGPLRAKGSYPAAIACNLTNGRMPHVGTAGINDIVPYVTHCGEERFVANIEEGTMLGYKYFDFGSCPAEHFHRTPEGNTAESAGSADSADSTSCSMPQGDPASLLTETVTITLTVRGEGTGRFDLYAGGSSQPRAGETPPEDLLGTIPVSPSADWQKIRVDARVSGTHALYLYYHGEGAVDLLEIAFG